MADLLNWDTEVFLWLNNLGTENWDGFWLSISQTKTWIPLYLMLLFMLSREVKGYLLLWTVLLVVLNVVLTDQGSTWLFKEQFQRLRPCHVEALQSKMRLVKASCGGQYGFLSAHAANTFGMAILVGKLTRKRFSWLFPVLLLWAAFVAYSRIYIGVHYPLDVIAGAIYGLTCGFLLYKLYARLIQAFYREPN